MLITGTDGISSFSPDYQSGAYVCLPGIIPIGSGTANAGINTFVFSPFFLPKSITISELAARITTVSAGGNMQLGLYRCDRSLRRPTSTPLCRTGNLSTAVATNVNGALSGGNASIPAGLLFAAAIYDNAVAGVQIPGSNVPMLTALLGTTNLANIGTAATTVNVNLSLANTGAFGTWPDVTGAAFAEITTLNGVVAWGRVA